MSASDGRPAAKRKNHYPENAEVTGSDAWGLLFARVILPFGVPLELRRIEVHIPQITCAVPRRLIVEVLRPLNTVLSPAETALARTLSPNSTTDTKLFPLVPYHFFVPEYARAPNDASEPHVDDTKPTGMLGPASLND